MGGFTVSAGQLQTNQKISQAAVRRSNRGLNYLAPIRTTTTDAADDGNSGVKPLGQISGSGDGWTSGQIASLAITSAKLAAAAVTTERLANEAVTTAKLGGGAVATDNIATRAVTRDKLEADVQDNLPLSAAVTSAGALDRGRNAVTAVRSLLGIQRVTFNRSVASCTWNATPAVDTGSAAGREIIVARDQTHGTGQRLRLDIFDSVGAATDSGFHVQVVG